jgi:uncharacterized membrane protein YkoI
MRYLMIGGAALALAGGVAVAQPGRGAEVIGIPKAVSIAEAAAGGKALEAEMDYERGRLVYEVKATAQKGVREVLVDALSGEVVSDKPLRMDSVLRGWRDADQISAVRAASTPLASTLTRLETERSTRVKEVSIEREQGQTFYEVEMADGGANVLIDPRTGRTRPGRYDD